MMSTRPRDPAVLGRAAAGLPEEAGGVAVVHHDQRVVAVGEVADLAQRRDVAVHGEDAVGRDQPRPRSGVVLEMRLEIAHVAVGVPVAAGPSTAGCRR